MPAVFISKCPPTFEPGRPYFWQERDNGRESAAAIPVTFIAYDPCPAFVIVRTEAGERRRCLREQLYSMSQPG